MNEAGTGHQVGQTASCWMMRRRRTRNTDVGVWGGGVSLVTLCVYKVSRKCILASFRSYSVGTG